MFIDHTKIQIDHRNMRGFVEKFPNRLVAPCVYFSQNLVLSGNVLHKVAHISILQLDRGVVICLSSGKITMPHPIWTLQGERLYTLTSGFGMLQQHNLTTRRDQAPLGVRVYISVLTSVDDLRNVFHQSEDNARLPHS